MACSRGRLAFPGLVNVDPPQPPRLRTHKLVRVYRIRQDKSPRVSDSGAKVHDRLSKNPYESTPKNTLPALLLLQQPALGLLVTRGASTTTAAWVAKRGAYEPRLSSCLRLLFVLLFRQGKGEENNSRLLFSLRVEEKNSCLLFSLRFLFL